MTAAFGAKTFGVNGIAPRSLGKPAASYPGSIATDLDLAIGVDRLQTRLAVPLDSVSGTMTVENAAGIVAGVLLTIDSEIVQVTGAPSGSAVPVARGFDGTAAAIHLASAAVSGFIDAYHHNTLASEIQAIEQALGPNLSAIPTAISVSSAAYDFGALTPGGALTVGANSVTLAPMPAGLAPGNYLYIEGGTGAAEAVPLLGVSPTSVVVNCANAHSGPWTIRSATDGVQEAMVAVSAMAALAEVLVSKPSYFYAVAHVPLIAADRTISLRGQGKSTFSIFRHTSYRGGPLLFYNAVNATNQIGFEIHDMLIMDGAPDHSWTPNTGSAAIKIKSCLPANRVIDNVAITNPYVGIDLEGCYAVEIHNVLIGWGANPTVKPFAGIYIHGINAILSNPGSMINISDVQITPQAGSTVNNVNAGIVIAAVDGCQITNSSIIQTDVGVYFASFGATDQIDHVVLNAVMLDAQKVNSVLFTGTGPAYVADIAIRNCSLVMWARGDAAPSSLGACILIDSSSRIFTLEITDNFIVGAGLAGVLVAGQNLKKLLIAGNRITDSNALGGGYSGIQLLPGVKNTLIQGNSIGDTGFWAGRVTPYAISIDSSGGTEKITIAGNDLRNTGTGAVVFLNGVPPTLVMANNGGVDDVLPTLAAAASIPAPVGPAFHVIGTTTITTMTGGWIGARKTLVKNDAGSLTVGGGGNIPGVHTLAQNQSITLTWSGTAWY